MCTVGIVPLRCFLFHIVTESHFSSTGCRCDSRAVITESVSPGSNAGWTAALCPLHYKSPRHQRLTANESSCYVLLWPSHYFENLTLAFQRNCWDYNWKREGVVLFHFYFQSASLHRRRVLMFLITKGILFGNSFCVLRAAHFWETLKNWVKNGV